MKGISSANWIIERICKYADAVGEPFPERELALLRKPVEYFDETNRAEFVKINAKTVQMIRETIMDEKLDGTECVEVRPGLFIPPQWKQNYLEVYESDLPWLISHCAQNAMLHDPTLGESTPWQSPRITSGFRDSVLKKPLTLKEEMINSSDEFELLSGSVNQFLLTCDLIVKFQNFFNQLLKFELTDLSETQFLARSEALSIFKAFSDIDDDVTSAWVLFLLDEKIHLVETDKRDLLRSHTHFGISQAISMESGLADAFISFKVPYPPSVFYISTVLNLDILCRKCGIEPIGTKLYAARSLDIAMIVAKSSVFSTESISLTSSVFDFGSNLMRMIDVVESFDPDKLSVDDLIEELSDCRVGQTDLEDLMNVVNIGTSLRGESLSEWTRGFLGTLRTLFGPNSSDDRETEGGNFEENSADSSVLSSAARLGEIADLLNQGLISEVEFESKRQEIIDQI